MIVARDNERVGGELCTRADRRASSLNRYLPLVVLATFAVVVLPVLAVAALQTSVRPLPAAASVLLAMLLSIAAARVGSAIWMRQPQSRDLVFGDLIIWGWLRRLRAERRLADATGLLASGSNAAPRRAELLPRLAAALEAMDPYTHRHTQRVTRHAEMIARRMGISAEQVAAVRAAAAVHDVGKVRTPRSILTKPGSLTHAERAVIERHASDGAELVSAIGDPELTAMVRHHHERVDGTGYPDRLAAGEIPLGARIIAVADTFDALTSSRSYRAACSHKQALDVIRAKSGTQLDADAAGAFLSYYSGRRLVAVSALVLAGPQRFLGWLGNALYGAGAVPVVRGVTTVGATAVIGGSLLSPVAPGQARSLTTPSAAAAKISQRALATPEAVDGEIGRSGRRTGRRAPARSRPNRPAAEPANPDPAPPRNDPQQAPSDRPGDLKLDLPGDALGPANAARAPELRPLPELPPAPELPPTPELPAIPELPPSPDVPGAPGI